MELICRNLRLHVLFVLLTVGQTAGEGQRTLGLLYKNESSSPGYTLFAPSFSRDAFLVDECGYLVKKWTFPQPSLDISLLRDGRLLRTSRAAGNFTGGGAGVRIEIVSWEGMPEWSITLADTKMHHHHDAQLLPNGNILLSVWYKYSREEASRKGFKVEKLTNEGIWSDRILEIKPLPDNEYTVVWEWDFWDHTIQDINPSLPDFGMIADFPERLDVNFSEDPGANPAEWLHVNSLDYNERLDQILISSKFHNEVYIIDHSTSTEEAKGHSGGKYGRGGDFLYRWGNPRSYGRGTRDQHWLYGQHDAQWIPDSLPGAGRMLLFNNGSNRIGELYSTIDEINLPDNGTGVYPLPAGQRYEPALPAWMYIAEPRSSLYSARISGVQRLPGGNTLICEGNTGRFLEVNERGELVWLYRNPVNQQGPGMQGSQPANLDVFQIHRYPKDDPAFSEKELIPMGPIELGSNGYDCKSVSVLPEDLVIEPAFFPNPAAEFLTFRVGGSWKIGSSLGQIVLSGIAETGDNIDLSTLAPGRYNLRLTPKHGQKSDIFSLIKL